MHGEIHPMAPHHIPWYLPGPDGSDGLFTFTVWMMIGLLLVVGNLYLRLHAVPERLAHSSNHTQQQAVTILALLALFTHNNIYWVIALFIAVVRWPDFSTPLNAIADSLERIEKRDNPPESRPTLTGSAAPADVDLPSTGSPQGQGT
ncbi:MAG: hypothetical protein AAGG56_04670 [Pseudomonadota bacterium]